MSRIMPPLSLSNNKELVNLFFNSQFSFCPFIWVFHSGIINDQINRLHERHLHLLYQAKLSSFEKLLESNKSVTIHTRNLQVLDTKMFRVYRNIPPPIFSEISHRQDINYHLQINSESAMPNERSVFRRSESISYLGP